MICKKTNKSLLFSGSVKISTLGSKFKWEAWQASFPTGAVAPWVGIFLSTVDTNDGFYLSHMTVSAHWKDKKWTATCRPHTGQASIRDVIVILKWRHHVAPQRIEDFLEGLFIFQWRA